MTNLHILLDPVTDFRKCPKKGFKKSDFWRFLNNMLVPHSATRLAAPVTLTSHRVEYGVICLQTPFSSPVTVLYCTVLYCTVLYCTVLYCTVLYCTVLYCTVLYCTVLYCTVLYCIILYCTVLYLGVQRAPKSPLEELEVGGHRPLYLQVYIYCTVLYCTVLYCTVLYCTVLYCIVLYCIVLYCIVLYCIVIVQIYRTRRYWGLWPPTSSSSRGDLGALWPLNTVQYNII